MCRVVEVIRPMVTCLHVREPILERVNFYAEFLDQSPVMHHIPSHHFQLTIARYLTQPPNVKIPRVQAIQHVSNRLFLLARHLKGDKVTDHRVGLRDAGGLLEADRKHDRLAHHLHALLGARLRGAPGCEGFTQPLLDLEVWNGWRAEISTRERQWDGEVVRIRILEHFRRHADHRLLLNTEDVFQVLFQALQKLNDVLSHAKTLLKF
mmetsp:Transcript_25087/g.50992  ORF Transcript_25087/g.50992 Transcript_25087/m.50992 type:complete len:208 (+) Transcript_25087:773-1396(+)